MRLNQILVHHQHHLILIDLDIFNLHTLVNIPVTSLCNSHDYTINIQVSAVADGPARRLSYACPYSALHKGGRSVMYTGRRSVDCL